MTPGARPIAAAAGRWLGPTALAALFLCLLRWTWRKWPDPIVDVGLQLYNGWQLAAGRQLYRDVDWSFGPLTQYLATAWFRLAGVSLLSLVGLNLLTLAAITVLLHRLLAAVAGRAAATGAGLVFLGVFAFGQYLVVSNYNYLTPYTMEATQGMAVSLAALLLLSRFGRTGDRRSLAGVGLGLGLLFLNKPEYFAALLAGAGAGLAGILGARRARAREWISAGAWVAGAALLPVAATLAWLAHLGGLPHALAALVTPWGLLGRGGYVAGELYRTTFGLDDAGGNLRRLFAILGWHAAVAAPAFLIARRCRPGAAAALIGLGVGTATAALLWFFVPPLSWLDAALPLPLEAAAIALWAGRQLYRSRDGAEAARAGARLAAAVFALALLGRMLLSAQVSHYGFVLAMPASLLVVCALLGWLPERLEAAGGAGIAFRCAMGLVLAVLVAGHWRIERDLLAAKVHPVGEGRDRFWADRRGRNIDAAVAAVRALSAGDARLFVMPEGAVINYLARRENPSPLTGFLPNGFVEEASVLRMLAERRPELIVITDRPVGEFGVGPLGSGYGRQVMAHVRREYRLGAQIGPSPFLPGGDGIAVLVRNDYRP